MSCIIFKWLSITKIIKKVTTFQEIPGLTDGNVPRRLGPKRASKIRKLFNLSKEDDVRSYVVKRQLPPKEGKENAKPRFKVNHCHFTYMLKFVS